MNPVSQKRNECIVIEGKQYENLKQFDYQSVQSTTFIGNQIGNQNEHFIIKLYKEISDDKIELLKQIKRYQNEKLKCQHIIKIIGIQDFIKLNKEREFYIVMEKGNDNTQNLINSNTSFSLVQKLKIFEQMVRGVMELHSLGNFQLDLKPENFVYFETKNQNYQVKLIDFGLVKYDSTYLKTQQIGTFNYLAPEVMEGKQAYDKTADIWSLGIILYELLAPEDFFQAKKKQELEQQKYDLTQDGINKNINQANCLGQTEKDLVNSMLQKESQKRIQLEILLQKIDKYLTTIQEYEKKQKQLILQFSVIKSTNQLFIQKLIEMLNKINQIDTAEQKKQQLQNCINKEIWNYSEKMNENEQRLQQIKKAQMKEEFIRLEQELSQVNQQQQLQEQNLIMEKITKELNLVEQLVKNNQKLKMENEQQYQKLLKIVRDQSSLQSNQIQTLSEQYNFYQSNQKYINKLEKILDVRKQHQTMKEDIQILEQQEEKIMVQFDEQKITIYQQLNIKLEEIQEAQNRLKISIEEANTSIFQINRQIFDENHNQIDNLNDKLTDYLDKFKYQSQNQKYENKIDQIMNQIGVDLGKLNSLKQLITQGTLASYQQFNKNYYLIEQSLRDFQKQYNQLHEQIYNDQLFEQINIERIKKIKITQKQLDQIRKKMNQLVDQIKNLINTKYWNNQQIQNLINNKLIKIDQNIFECQKQFENFNELNLLNSYEVMKYQIQLLEEVQRKLDVDVNEIEYNIDQLKLITSKIDTENKSEEEKEIVNLKNQLQNTYRKFSQALNSINFQFESIEFYNQMNEQKGKFQDELKQEIQTLNEYLEVFNKNSHLFQIESQARYIQKKKSNYRQQIMEFLEKNKYQYTNQQKGYRLENVLNRVSKAQQELNFSFMDNNLIKNYDYLKMQDRQLSIELNLINQKTYNKQLNSQELNKFKEYILLLMMKIPEKYEIQEFNKAYQQNLESYEKLLALVIYIKQYHLTRYYERIKENKFQQKDKQQIKNESDFKMSFQYQLNVDLEENTKNEKEAQDILQRYGNVLNKTYIMMTKETMEKDKQQIEKKLLEIENQIKYQNLVKLESKLKDQSVIKEIINNRQYEFGQMLIYKRITQKYNNYQY